MERIGEPMYYMAATPLEVHVVLGSGAKASTWIPFPSACISEILFNELLVETSIGGPGNRRCGAKAATWIPFPIAAAHDTRLVRHTSAGSGPGPDTSKLLAA